MSDIKRLPFNADAAEEYFSMMLTCYRDTANDIFRRDNEGRHVSEQHYSAEYQKYLGMQIALREVLEYFGKYELGDRWISVEERLPHNNTYINVVTDGVVAQAYWHNDRFYAVTAIGVAVVGGVTHWMPLPEPPKGE